MYAYSVYIYPHDHICVIRRDVTPLIQQQPHEQQQHEQEVSSNRLMSGSEPRKRSPARAAGSSSAALSQASGVNVNARDRYQRTSMYHRWNRNPRPHPQTFSELVFLICFS